MTREDILNNSMGKGILSEISEMNKYIDQLEQQNTELQERIKELEANEEKLKREWYTIGSNDNYNALLKSGKLKQ